jgi:hypothetical protein
MRTLVAVAIFAAAMLSLDATADAATKSKRSAKQQHAAQQKSNPAVDAICEDRARNEDPAGQYANYPCWAREAFARGRNIDLH